MDPHAASPSALQALCTVGARMIEALAADDLAAFFALVEKRTALVDALKTAAHPAEVDPAWQEHAQALAEQERVLAEQLAAQETRLARALKRTRQQGEAHQRYSGDAAPPARSVLNPHLHG